MPYRLDKTDIAILKSLFEDGRKSFRQISRELKVSTPTINLRFQRLVTIGLIKSIVPILDTTKLEKDSAAEIEKCHHEKHPSKMNVSNGMSVKMKCDYCDGPIASKPQVFKFANIERFFCCTSCRGLYKEKYKGRIQSVINNN